MRHDGRQHDELRPITFDLDFISHPEGSVLITAGNTKVICNASVEDRVPPFCGAEEKAGLQLNTACCRGQQTKEQLENLLRGKFPAEQWRFNA